MDSDFWIELLIRVVGGLIAIALAILIAFIIWNSELPLWLKWFLLN